ncbi:MAG: AAA family ATPase [Candidatus Hodarchaeota archaeon]
MKMTININQILTPSLQQSKEEALLLIRNGYSVTFDAKPGEFAALCQALAKELDNAVILPNLALLLANGTNLENIRSKKYILFSNFHSVSSSSSINLAENKGDLLLGFQERYLFPQDIISLMNHEAILITNDTGVPNRSLEKLWVTIHVPVATAEDINFLSQAFSVPLPKGKLEPLLGLDLPQIISALIQIKCGRTTASGSASDLQFSDLVGLEKGKQILKEFVLNPIEQNQYDLITPGVILFGPPGNGKTSLILALKEIIGDKKIFEIKGEETQYDLYSLYARARTNRPAVIFVDDFDVLIKDNPILYKTLLNAIGNPKYAGVCTVLTSNADSTKRILLDSSQEALFRFGRIEHFIEITRPNQHERDQYFRQKLEMDGSQLDNLIKETEGFSFAALDYLRRLWELKKNTSYIKDEIKTMRKRIRNNTI